MKNRGRAERKDRGDDAVVLRIDRTVGRLAWCAASLVLASVCAELFRAGSPDHIVEILTLRGERNLPTFFSVFLLFLCAQLLWLVATLVRIDGGRYRAAWLTLSCGFAAMAIDEGWQFHERLNAVARDALRWRTYGAFHYTWVLPALIFVAAAGLLFLPFLLSLGAETRRRFVTAAAVYLGGAIGWEMAGGWLLERLGSASGWVSFVATLEEAFEMGGAILFIRALLILLAGRGAEIRIRVRTGASAPALPAPVWSGAETVSTREI